MVRLYSRSHSSRRTNNNARRTWLGVLPLEDRRVPAIFLVTNNSDGPVSNPGDLPGSLRQAIFDANAVGTDDIIDLTAVNGTISMGAGEFVVTGSTSFVGPGAGKLTIDALQASRHFNISDDAATQIQVSLSGMTLINGQAPDPATGVTGNGGSIMIRNEIVSLSGMVISNNKNSSVVNVGTGGGAISVGNPPIPTNFSGLGGQLSIIDSEIANNYSSNQGAGIHFTFPNTGGVGNKLTVINSTIADNTAQIRGGGIYFSGGNDTNSLFAMRNSTVSSNKVLNEFAGGLQISSTTGVPVSILNSTIANNYSLSQAGGGLVLNQGSGTITITGSIIADNFGPGGPDLRSTSGTTANLRVSNSIIGSTTGLDPSTNFTNVTVNHFGSALLNPLANNGGPTRTHMPQPGSPAINAASITATTLAAAAAIGDATISVASAAGLANGSRIRIDSEVFLVTNIAGTTLTVTRGQNGTFAASHAIGSAVNNGLTAITTLTAAAAIADTTIKVSSGTNLTVGSFVSLGSEIVQITAVSSSTVTLNRAQNGTVAAAHVLGAGVNMASAVQTTLSAAAAAGDVTIGVASAIGLLPGMSLLIDAELVAVTAVSGNTLTVARGQDSTVAAAHPSGRAIALGYDQRRAGNNRLVGAALDIGAVEVNPTLPFATATTSNVTVAGATPSTFTVTFTDDLGINVGTIKNNNSAIRVTGPGGFDVPATYVSLDDDTNNGTPRTAIYSFALPGGAWDYTDNGLYSVVVQPNQVSDTNGNFLNPTAGGPTDVVGQFTVAIGRSLVVTSASDAGPGSLRDAIELANANAYVTDSITFDTVSMGGNFVVLATQLDVTDPVMIDGPGITLDGGGNSRIMNIAGPGIVAAKITGVTFQNGKVVFGFGGAIQTDNEDLTLINCTFQFNSTDGGNNGGGAIAMAGIGNGSLTIINCVFDQNTTGGGGPNNSGGAIYAGAGAPVIVGPTDIVIQNSTFTNNKANSRGGVLAQFGGSLTIDGSTLANNTAGSSAGAVFVLGTLNSKGLLIRNSTITGNTAGGAGGGVYLNLGNTSGRFVIANSTIVDNVATTGPGGGVATRLDTSYLVDIESSVISGNKSVNIAPDLSVTKGNGSLGVGQLVNNSFIGIHDPTNGKISGTNNQLGSTALPLNAALAPLANNGGPTQTRRPFGGSPLVDVATPNATLATVAVALTANATSMTVSSSANLAVGMYLLIDSEIVQISAIAGTIVSLGSGFSPLRGLLGTTAAAHAIGAAIVNPYTPTAFDQRGAGFPRTVNGKTDIGSVEAENDTPSAKLNQPLTVISTAGQTPYTIQVVFTDNTALDLTTINGNSNVIRVTGPNGYNQLATFGNIVSNTGTQIVVNYTITSPGAQWTGNDNGYYTVATEAGQVSDLTGKFVEQYPLGTLRVSLPLNLVVNADNDEDIDTDGKLSLREAILAANNNVFAPDTITFSPAFFNVPRTISLTLGELFIGDALSIIGPGPGLAKVQGVNSRLFTIDTQGTKTPVGISGLTMAGGNGQSTIGLATGSAGGGAIMNFDEALNIDGCVFTANDISAIAGSYGGAILVNSSQATLNMTNSTVSGNTAVQGGGGIALRYGNTSMSIQNCIIIGNRVSNGSGGGVGATFGTGPGVGGSSITIDNTTIANNQAPQGGGLAWGNGTAAIPSRVVITNSTVSGNTAFASTGGGINMPSTAYITLQNSTVTGNFALTGGGGITLPTMTTYGVNASIINSIIAGNINRVTPDIVGGSSTTPFTLPVINSIIGAVDLSLTKLNNINSQIGSIAAPISSLLSPLVYNGGPTGMPTHNLLPGSPALNKGVAAVAAVPLTNLATAATAGSTTIKVDSAAVFMAGVQYVIDGEIVQFASKSSTTITLTAPLVASHALGAVVNRPAQAAPPANDQRGVGFPRQIGTIDIGAVEVDSTVPVASSVFAPVTKSGAGNQALTITFSDDVAMNMTTIAGNNSAIRITGPGGFNQLAKYVSATPGIGAAVEQVTYTFTPPGGTWGPEDDGLYTVSIEANQVSDGTNFVFGTTVNTLQVAIPRSYVVDVTDDLDDGLLGVGQLSIREALKLANANANVTDVITFDKSVFATPQTISLTLGELLISDPVTIVGAGAGVLTIDALQVSRLMTISMSATNWGSTVTLSGMTLANGRATTQGAGISNENAALTIDGCVLSNNSTTSSGGAVWLQSIYAQPLTVTNSTFTANSAFSGSSIYVANNGSALTTVPNSVVVNIANTTFDGNNTQTSGTSNSGSGAGIYMLAGAKVTVTDSTFVNNVVGTSGAAIFNNGGILNVVRSVFSDNNAVSIAAAGGGQGGAVFLGSTAGTVANITSSTFANNTAGNIAGVSTGAGGAIFASSGSVLNVESSTLSGNSGNSTSTTSGGGAIYLTGTAQVVISNSTLSGNSARSLGGAIFLNSLTTSPTPSLGGSLIIRNSTVAFNSASGATGGGGVHWRTTTGTGTPTVTIDSSIVAMNSGIGAPDIKSGAAAQSFVINKSFIGDVTGATFTGAGNLNGDPLLDPTLALNGAPAGSPLTHALLGGSTAIDAGSNNAALPFDQRGSSFSRTANLLTDMGAFETQNATPLATVTNIQINNGAAQRSLVTSIKVTFSEAVSFPNGINTAFSLNRTFAPSGPTGSVNISAVQVGNEVTITFVNGGDVTLDPGASLPDGLYTLTVLSNRIANLGGFLDGNGNGVYQGPGIDDATGNLHRLFGDADGDRDVDTTDYAAFRLVYGSVGPSIFDFDADGDVDTSDFGQFRTRFGATI